MNGNGVNYASSGSFVAGATVSASEPYLRLYVSEDTDTYYFVSISPSAGTWTLPTGWPGGTYYNVAYSGVPSAGGNWPMYMVYLADDNGTFLYGLMDESGGGYDCAISTLSKQCITLNIS